MEGRISRRAALKALAASALLGCSPEGSGGEILAPLLEGDDGSDKDVNEQLPVSYLSTERLQDINGIPTPGNVYVYGVQDDTLQLLRTARVGADGLLPRIPIEGRFSKVFVVGLLSGDSEAVSDIVSFMPLLDFPHDREFIGPLDLKVLRFDQIPEGFDRDLYTNYLQNLNWVDGDGRGVTHAFQFSVQNDVWTEVSGQYLRPFLPEVRNDLKLFIPEVSFKGLPLDELGERDRVIDGLTENLRKFVPNLDVVVDRIGTTGAVRLLGGRYEVDPGYLVLSLERQHWQSASGASIVPIETAIEAEFQGELRGAFGSIYLTKRITDELMVKIVAKSAAQCVGLTGNAPFRIPPHLTIMTHGAFYHESPEGVAAPEITAFKLANAYPARRGNNRRRPTEVLRDVLPTHGQSVESLGSSSAARAATPQPVRGVGSVRAVPLPLETSADGSYAFSKGDVETCLRHNFEGAAFSTVRPD